MITKHTLELDQREITTHQLEAVDKLLLVEPETTEVTGAIPLLEREPQEIIQLLPKAEVILRVDLEVILHQEVALLVEQEITLLTEVIHEAILHLQEVEATLAGEVVVLLVDHQVEATLVQEDNNQI